MSIAVEDMDETVRTQYLSQAESIIEADDEYSHEVAGRDAVRLAYILYQEDTGVDIWPNG